MHPKQLENVFALTSKQRYEHFISKVCDWEELWILADQNQDFLIVIPQENLEYLPVWPHADYASAFHEIYPSHKPSRVELDSFLEIWLPNLNDDELTWAFIRGYFDGDGTIRHINSHALSCSISSNSINMLTAISKFSNIPCEKITNELTYNGTNCLDFLGKLYGDASNELYLLRKYNLYLQWMNWKPSLRGSGSQSNIGLCKVYKTDKNAILPSKSNISDVGYDLTIIKEIKKNNTNTVMYDTGIKIKLDYGYYAEIVPRSSLSKSGYMLSNSIGIIDNSYRGNLYIPLTKVELDAPDLELPFKCCQLIIREQIHINMIEVAEDIIDNTTRDNGGFGSTNSN